MLTDYWTLILCPRPTNARVHLEDAMRGTHKANEMKCRASQRRAAQKARLAALTLKAERRTATEARKTKKEVGSKDRAKSTVKAGKPDKR
jgi:prophage tail gpP-like protein